MCIIITSDTEFPFNRVLELAELKNSHGGGIAWIEKDKVRWIKGIDLTAKEIGNFRHYTKGPWVIHFRIATNGGITSELNHPFPVGNVSNEESGEADAIIAHNGHWWAWKHQFFSSLEEEDIIPDGAWSDSRAMAWLLGKYGEDYTRFIHNQRIAYLDKTGIRRYGEGWLQHGPLWLSNDLFNGRFAHSIDRKFYIAENR